METRWRQVHAPNLGVAAIRGWCLKYIDDAGSAPSRRATAQLALNAEANTGRLRRNQDFPVGVWVVGFWSLNSGVYKGIGHVAFIKNLGGGRLDIRDSEVRAGARAPYSTISQVNSWFGNFSPRFEGWSTECDGRRYAESYQVNVSTGKLIKKSGTATVIVDGLNVRAGASTNTAIAAMYVRGQKFNYDSYIDVGSDRWLSYIARSGNRRYVMQRKGNTNYVNGGA